MDYEKLAEDLCDWDLCCGMPACPGCQKIAQALREAAAQAYDEAAKFIAEGNDCCTERIDPATTWCGMKAAALRAGREGA